MTNYKKLIRDIQTAATNSALPIEFLVDLNAEYGEACESVNARLTQIVGLLVEGYRDEAIQIAEQSPNVSDQLTQLDFPERWNWIELVSEHQLEVPPCLMMSAASELERAYDEVRRLEPLLKRNRLLALAQAPLSARITTLQQLYKHDPTNPIWVDDLELLQRKRLVEIKEEFQIAKAQDRTDVLTELAAELNQKWEIPIPQSLLDTVSGTSQRMERDQAREKMVGIADWLNRVLLEYDAEGGRKLRTAWHEMNQTAMLAPDDEVALSAQEPLNWLAELDAEEAADQEFEIAVADLELAVEQQEEIEVLDRKIYEAQKFEREIPENLIHRVNHYRDSLEFSDRRKGMLRIGLIVAALLTVIGAITWFMISQSASRELADARTQMEQFVTDDGFESGKTYFQGLPEHLQKDADVIRFRDKLATNESNEADRLARTAELFELTDLDGPVGPKLNNYVSELKELAVTESETKKVKTLENNLRSERLQRQNERNQLFISAIGPLSKQVEELSRAKGTASTISELESVIAKINQTVITHDIRVDGMNGISGTTSNVAQGLVGRAKAKIREVESANKTIRDLSQLKSSLSNASQFASALTRFAKNHPLDPNAVGFTKSATEAGLRGGFEQWRNLGSLVRNKDLDLLTREQATEILASIEAARRTLDVGAIDSDQFESFLVEKQTEADLEKEKRRLSAILSQSSYSLLNAMYQEDKVYFLEGEIDEKARSIKTIGPDASTVRIPREDGDKFGRAVHCELALDIRELIPEITRANRDDKIVELIELAVNYSHEGKTPEPVAHLEVLNILMGFIETNSSSFSEFAAEKSETWDIAGLIGSDWKCTTAARVVQLRPTIARELEQLREDVAELDSVSDEAGDAQKTMLGWTSVADYKLAGFVYQVGDSEWYANPITEIPRETVMFSIFPTGASSCDFKPIGNYSNGSIANQKVSVVLQAGRPFYIKKENN